MKFTTHKAWMAGVGASITALSTFWTSASLILSDDQIDLNEYGSLTTLVVSLVATVYAVWKAPYKPVES